MSAPEAGGADAAGSTLVEELAEVPPLSTSLRRGLVASTVAAVRHDRGLTPFDLPAVRLAARGLAADAVRLTAYEHLVGATASDDLPAGFVHVLAFPVMTALMVRPEFPLPLLGMVHLANTVTQRRPVRLDEALDVEVHAERLAAHHRGVSVDLVAEVSVADEPVWRGVSTYLAKGYALAGESAERVERPDWRAPTPTGAWRLPADLGRRYAAVSGDHNPIHTSTLAAKAFGFPRTIAHGMYTAARALAEIGEPDAFTWHAEFFAPVVLPGTASVRIAKEGNGGVLDAWGKRHHLHVSVTAP
ncbi:MaoC/PaaZ C-terminal domain-containing protein [Isoptericola sp. b441]|uniref:MaoC/PaaZ C-terminal domain-containing protein n=1 Tax=Actinotalea lenta TaxID=3064654 RepID=A0ABT9D9P6_9CELL|nr:MaoC/PaaZ C-terminal domain-containing protein [Isoptericola sp. b441]MDO8105898.1 MaoC/PaaZ C-terminal domain-containing protein [Isoptericola sp. b441]